MAATPKPRQRRRSRARPVEHAASRANIGVTIINWAGDSVASVGRFSTSPLLRKETSNAYETIPDDSLCCPVARWWPHSPRRADSNFGVGPQYDTTHVYVQPEDFDKFVASLLATFGGTTTKQGVFTVTPTPSRTMSQLVLTPVGTVSVFGFKTPVPYPFGLRTDGLSGNRSGCRGPGRAG